MCILFIRIVMVANTQHIIELENVIIKQLFEGIHENHIKAGKDFNVTDAWTTKKNNLDLCDGKGYCVLITLGHLSNVTKDARIVTSSKEYGQKTIAKAILVETLGEKLLGNFYITVNKPFTKTKLFNDRETAISWLKSEFENYQAS